MFPAGFIVNNGRAMKPLVSVVMPVYNGIAAGPGYLWKALDSLVRQDYDGPIEILLLDDGSKDETVAQAEKWAEHINQSWKSRRLFVISRSHEGVTKILNVGIEKAEGEFIARHDADDFSETSRIRKQVEFLVERPEMAMVGSAARIYHDNRNRQEVWYRWGSDTIKPQAFKNENPYCHGSVMLRRSVLMKVGGYDERFAHAQDYDLFWRIAKQFPVGTLPEPLYCYRVHDRRVTSKRSNFQIQLECSRSIQRRINRELKEL